MDTSKDTDEIELSLSVPAFCTNSKDPMPLFTRRTSNFIGFNDYGKLLGRKRSEMTKGRFFTRNKKEQVQDKIQANEPPPPSMEVPETNEVEVPETNDDEPSPARPAMAAPPHPLNTLSERHGHVLSPKRSTTPPSISIPSIHHEELSSQSPKKISSPPCLLTLLPEQKCHDELSPQRSAHQNLPDALLVVDHVSTQQSEHISLPPFSAQTTQEIIQVASRKEQNSTTAAEEVGKLPKASLANITSERLSEALEEKSPQRPKQREKIFLHREKTENTRKRVIIPPPENKSQESQHGTPRTARVATLHASCCDARHPVAMILNGKREAFWATTGMYPQATELSFETNLRLTELDLVCCPEIIRLTISCASKGQKHWQDIAVVGSDYDTLLDDAKRKQDQRKHLHFKNRQPPLVCSRLRLCIERAATDFALVRHLRVVGIPVL